MTSYPLAPLFASSSSAAASSGDDNGLVPFKNPLSTKEQLAAHIHVHLLFSAGQQETWTLLERKFPKASESEFNAALAYLEYEDVVSINPHPYNPQESLVSIDYPHTTHPSGPPPPLPFQQFRFPQLDTPAGTKTHASSASMSEAATPEWGKLKESGGLTGEGSLPSLVEEGGMSASTSGGSVDLAEQMQQLQQGSTAVSEGGGLSRAGSKKKKLKQQPEQILSPTMEDLDLVEGHWSHTPPRMRDAMGEEVAKEKFKVSVVHVRDASGSSADEGEGKVEGEGGSGVRAGELEDRLGRLMQGV